MPNIRAASRALLFAALIPTVPLIVAGTCALAQSDTSSISGTVTDPSGAVVPNASVMVRNDATGQMRSVNSNSVGAYTLTNLPSGTLYRYGGIAGFPDRGAAGHPRGPEHRRTRECVAEIGQHQHHGDRAGECEPAADRIGVGGPTGDGRSR